MKLTKKDTFKCTACTSQFHNKESISYKGMITQADIKSCSKCFIREFGKKTYEKAKEKE